MQWTLFGSVLLMGFLGSWHCGVMCGPLSCNLKNQKDFFSYHVGRLISYLIIGTVIFYGSHYFLDAESRTVKAVASIVFGLAFIYFGLSQMDFIKNRLMLFKYYKIQFKIIERHKKIAREFPIILGLLTGLFPCMWLYSFLILASQLNSMPEALGVILLFWLSALPAFIVLTGFMQSLVKAAPVSHQKISGLILIVAGVFSVVGHWAEIMFL